MSVTPNEIAASRALRDEARALAIAHLEEVRAELSPQAIGQKIKHVASQEAIEVLDGTRAVAAENKLVIGAVGVALTGWFARKPLIGLYARLVRFVRSRKPERLWPWFVR